MPRVRGDLIQTIVLNSDQQLAVEEYCKGLNAKAAAEIFGCDRQRFINILAKLVQQWHMEGKLHL